MSMPTEKLYERVSVFDLEELHVARASLQFRLEGAEILLTLKDARIVTLQETVESQRQSLAHADKSLEAKDRTIAAMRSTIASLERSLAAADKEVREQHEYILSPLRGQ